MHEKWKEGEVQNKAKLSTLRGRNFGAEENLADLARQIKFPPKLIFFLHHQI